ncbi:MAG TPA: sterol desaturase family protein [Rhizomicrobium sp.]|jgi:sterol desaturase/sphingolipid hydroxylase (fatty acid hydroxylase superfamily)|nr:sterol desaturase family protein [Rhizomicrobium sp.]
MVLAAELVDGFAHTLGRVLPYLAGMGVVFALLSWLSPCNKGRPWWSKEGLVTDITYQLVVPLIGRYGRIGFAVLFTAYLLGIDTADGLVKFFDHGHGPISALPLWSQCLLYLVAGDFFLYWIHRAFHGAALWRYHAIHHASEELEWISAARFHPVNLLLGTIAVDVAALMAGITPDIFLVVGPFNVISSAFVHANLDWTLGPFKYVVAGPVFHRWHHTRETVGRNFAGTFSLWDWMFGTFHMPQGALPENYGIADSDVPESFGLQMLYPVLPGRIMAAVRGIKTLRAGAPAA